MEKEIVSEIKTYVPSDIILSEDLLEMGFIQELECTSNKHICLTDGNKKLILEILKSGKEFKIYDIR